MEIIDNGYKIIYIDYNGTEQQRNNWFYCW